MELATRLLLLDSNKKKPNLFPSTTLQGAELRNFNAGSSRYVRSSSGGLDFRPGKTLYISVDFTATTSTDNEVLVGCYTGAYGAGKGWVIERGASSDIIYLTKWDGGGYVVVASLSTSLALGVHQIAITWKSDNSIHVSVDGATASNIGSLTAPNTDGTCTVVIGSPVAAGSVYANSLGGGIACFGMIASELSNANLAIASNSMNGATPNNRFTLPSLYSSPVVDFNAYRDWDGSASTITTQGSSAITFAVTGAISKTDVSEVYYAASANMYHDNKLAVSETYAVRHNQFARLRFTTSGTRVTLHQTSTIQGLYGGHYASVSVWSNSSYQSLSTAANANVSEVHDVTLPAGSNKIIDLIEGSQTYYSGSVLGTFISGIRIPTDGVITAPTAPANRAVVMIDSIGSGFINTNSQTDNPIAVLRSMFDGQVTALGWGSASTYDFSNSGVVATWAASIASMLDGASTNRLVFQMMTNDYGLSLQSTANYATNTAALIDAVKALVPNLQVIFLTAISRISPAAETANGLGSTLDDYRTAASGLTSGRSWVRVVTGKYCVSNANHDADGIHVTTDGAASIGYYMAAACGWTPSGLSPAAWYKAESGITLNGSNVSQWDDQSGNGRHLVQATSARQPAYLASSGPNSRPCLRFSYLVRSLLKCTTNLLSTGTQYTYFVVNKRPSSTQNCILTSFENAILTDQVVSGGAYNYTDTAAYGVYGYTDTNWTYRCQKYDGSLTGNANRLKVYDKRTQQTLTFTGSIPATLTTSTYYHVGCYYVDSSTWDFDGDVSELIIFTSALSAANQAKVEAYLAVNSAIYN